MADKETYTAEEVEAIKADLEKKHNSEMAQLRTRNATEIEKAKKEATMTAEELAAQKAKEQNEAMELELKELRTYKSQAELGKRLEKEGLPSFFVNDNRLLGAMGDEKALNDVIKTIKSEVSNYKPNGSTTSTVVKQTDGIPNPSGAGKYAGFDEELRRKLGY